MATGDLTTLDNVRAWLNIAPTVTSDDALLARLITSASQYIQSWLNRTIPSTSYTERKSGSGSDTLALANYPCTAVSSLTIRGTVVNPSPDGQSAGYVFDDRFIYLIGNPAALCMPGLAPGIFPEWPPLGVTIQYTAGYATVPPEIEQACIEMLSLRYQERDRIGYQSKSLAGETVSFSLKDMPDSVATILMNYKKVVPV